MIKFMLVYYRYIWYSMFMKRFGRFLAILNTSVVLAVAGLALVNLNVAGISAASEPLISRSTASSSVLTNNDSLVYLKDIEFSANPLGIPLGVTLQKTDSFSDQYLLARSIISNELIKYDRTELAGSGLKKIYLVLNLNVQGQYRSGMPEPIHEDALYFDIQSKYLQSEDGNYYKRVVHHELAHLTYFNLYHSYGSYPAWTKCQPNARYGDGGGSMYANPDYAHKMHPSVGFINGYATSAPEEDIAEVWAFYMVDRQLIYDYAKNDPILDCKVNLIRNRIITL